MVFVLICWFIDSWDSLLIGRVVCAPTTTNKTWRTPIFTWMKLLRINNPSLCSTEHTDFICSYWPSTRCGCPGCSSVYFINQLCVWRWRVSAGCTSSHVDGGGGRTGEQTFFSMMRRVKLKTEVSWCERVDLSFHNETSLSRFPVASAARRGEQLSHRSTFPNLQPSPYHI